MREKFLLVFLGSFVLGVALRSFVEISFAFAVFLVVIAFNFFILERTGASKNNRIVFLAICFLGVAFGIVRFDISEAGKKDPALLSYVNQKVVFQGVVSDEPDEREDSLRLVVETTNVSAQGNQYPVSARVLVVSSLYPKIKYGDEVEVSGVLTVPKNFADQNGRIFDYQGYLAKESVYFQVFRPTVTVLGGDKGNPLVAKLFAGKQIFLQKIAEELPEPHSSLLGGLIVGAKRSLGENLLEDFRKAGVIHIVVLSGYNITIVAEAVMKFFSFLPRFAGQLFGAFSIVLFAILTGGSATVVRASIMALLVILAKVVSRKYHITRALIFAGVLMILQNPKILVFDSSFQLSFMSTLALIYVSPLVEKKFSFVTEKFGLRSVVVATLSTQIFVLPMLLYKMGELSLVALPTNLLILSIIPATMFFGFFAGVFSFVSKLVAFPFSFITYGLLEYELKVVEFFAHLPFASLKISFFPLWLAVAVYVAYAVFFFLFKEKSAPENSKASSFDGSTNVSEPF